MKFASRPFARITALLTITAFVLASCGGGGGSTAAPVSTAPVSVYTAPAQEALTSADVQKILSQAIEEATARGKPAVIAITDRPGNVLAVFAMNGAPTTLTVKTTTRSVTTGDLEGLVVPGSAAANPLVAAAIAKAITGAYLSSGGNAFSTRTASMIVQEHYPPGNNMLSSGPLFGVQFSQLPCSDLSSRYMTASGPGALIGPKRSPLGLSADPGGFPLYKNGVMVGGIGIESDGLYSYDTNIDDTDASDDEYIALAGTSGFDAPSAIRADQIQVVVQLRYSDATMANLRSVPANARSFATLNGTVGNLASVRGYYAEGATTPTVLAGTAYGSEASGLRPVTAAERSAGTAIDNPDAYILSNGSGTNRYPIRAATDAGDVAAPLTAAEVKAVMEEAFKVMSHARGQIRKPLDSRAQVTISVVDTRGSILGVVRGPDAPIFGTDVSLQKARTATFFSGVHAAPDLSADASPDVQSFVQKVRTFLSDPTALTGKFAFADRSGGDLSRPYFPDGETSRPNGPLSRPFSDWSPFNTGLQSALIVSNIATHVGYILGANADTLPRCTTLPDVPGTGQNRLQNGLQIFPGSVPIFRGNVLVGGIGVSGDGIDQDDMISFLGLYNGGQRVGSIGEAPMAIRADQIVVAVGGGVRLRFVSCPFAPFVDTSDQNVCDGK